MKHIIIEGPDGAGKTSLARAICANLGYGYHHEGPPPQGVCLLTYYASLLHDTIRPTVFDRLHVGETVYGPILRGESRLSDRDMRILTRLIKGQGMSLIYCLPPQEVCEANTAGRKEYLSDEQRGRAYTDWQFASGRYYHNAQVFNYVRASAPMSMIYPTLPPCTVGSPVARVLFVGEQPNGALDLPFFGAKHSSVFLDECLQVAGYVEEEVAFTNALDAQGRARDLGFIISQMPKLTTVVALGRVPEAQLERQDIPHFVKQVTLPHPAYWKRFHSGDQHGYIQQLKGVRYVA